jgi:predicted cupin superfamily sugar epimerase
VVIPGFEYEDFEMGEREALLAGYPQHEALVRALT